MTPEMPIDPTPVLDPLLVRNSGYVTVPRIRDARDGVLCVFEAQRQIPFDIRRVYFITGLESSVSVRGRHAHRKLRQVIFAISGSFELVLDDGQTRQTIKMWRENVGVVLEPGLWHEMQNFTSGCVILVFASDYYEESDYIRGYDDFLKWAATRKGTL